MTMNRSLILPMSLPYRLSETASRPFMAVLSDRDQWRKSALMILRTEGEGKRLCRQEVTREQKRLTRKGGRSKYPDEKLLNLPIFPLNRNPLGQVEMEPSRFTGRRWYQQ